MGGLERQNPHFSGRKIHSSFFVVVVVLVFNYFKPFEKKIFNYFFIKIIREKENLNLVN